MRTVFACYEHSTIGFPKIKLKWYEDNGTVGRAYWVKHDIIQTEWTWRNQYPTPFIQSELARFDEWVRNVYQNDISVQG